MVVNQHGLVERVEIKPDSPLHPVNIRKTEHEALKKEQEQEQLSTCTKVLQFLAKALLIVVCFPCALIWYLQNRCKRDRGQDGKTRGRSGQFTQPRGSSALGALDKSRQPLADKHEGKLSSVQPGIDTTLRNDNPDSQDLAMGRQSAELPCDNTNNASPPSVSDLIQEDSNKKVVEKPVEVSPAHQKQSVASGFKARVSHLFARVSLRPSERTGSSFAFTKSSIGLSPSHFRGLSPYGTDQGRKPFELLTATEKRHRALMLWAKLRWGFKFVRILLRSNRAKWVSIQMMMT